MRVVWTVFFTSLSGYRGAEFVLAFGVEWKSVNLDKEIKDKELDKHDEHKIG